MSNSVSNGRGLILGAVAVALLAGSGCSMFRSNTGYELSPESRPLEIPPELNAPATDGGLVIPEVRATAPQVQSKAFSLQDTVDGAYGRVGIALERIDGVTISERSKLLNIYTVSYQGETFMIRVSEQQNGARVQATTTGGSELHDGAAAALLGLLRARLG